MSKDVRFTFAVDAQGNIHRVVKGRSVSQVAGADGASLTVAIHAPAKTPGSVMRGLQKALDHVGRGLPSMLGDASGSLVSPLVITPGMVVLANSVYLDRPTYGIFLGESEGVVCLTIFDQNVELVTKELPRHAYSFQEIKGFQGVSDLAACLVIRDQHEKRQELLELMSENSVVKVACQVGKYVFNGYNLRHIHNIENLIVIGMRTVNADLFDAVLNRLNDPELIQRLGQDSAYAKKYGDSSKLAAEKRLQKLSAMPSG